MATVNESAWNEQDNLTNTRGYTTDTVTAPSDNVVDPDEDDLDEDDDLADDDLDYDEDDLDEDDLDDDTLADEELDEDQDGYNRVGGVSADNGLSSGVANSYDNDDDTLPGGDDSEIPEQNEADNEGQGYERGEEVQQQNHNDEASYSERNDVTPPTPHEFPDHGTHTETDFASRNQGRTTGRMVGHEPGTEGGI